MNGQQTVGTRIVPQLMKKQPQKEGEVDSIYAGAVQISKGSGSDFQELLMTYKYMVFGKQEPKGSIVTVYK